MRTARIDHTILQGGQNSGAIEFILGTYAVIDTRGSDSKSLQYQRQLSSPEV